MGAMETKPGGTAGVRVTRPRRADPSSVGLARVPRGSMVHGQGFLSDGAWIITGGFVMVSACTQAGREAVLAVLGPGDLVGTDAVLSGRERGEQPPLDPQDERPRATTTAIALTNCELRRVDLWASDTTVPREVVDALVVRLRLAERSLLRVMTEDLQGRTLGCLQELAARLGAPAGEGRALPVRLRQDQLAAMVGTTRESMNRVLRRLRDRGWIDGRGQSLVVRRRPLRLPGRQGGHGDRSSRRGSEGSPPARIREG
jgi:CRP/FNR family transcriptional regulator, cyclic AMP receptor protein